MVDTLQRLIDETPADDASTVWLPLLGVGPIDVPDLTANLIHQKLQMLYCCGKALEHQAKAEKEMSNYSKSTGKPKDLGKGSKTQVAVPQSGWEDEILLEDLDELHTPKGSSTASDSPPPSDDGKCEQLVLNETGSSGLAPQGSPPQRKQATTFGLLADATRQAVFPQVHIIVPVCSDTVNQQEDEMVSMGTSSASQTARAWAQRGMLASDIAAFKYLNQASGTTGKEVLCFADFVRWHSPADFVESPTEEVVSKYGVDLAHVSQRMREPGNLWQTLWRETKPELGRLPFNAAQELVLTLHWLKEELVRLPLLSLYLLHSNFSFTLFQLQCHRLHAQLPTLQRNFEKINRSLGNSLASLEQLVESLETDHHSRDEEVDADSAEDRPKNFGDRDDLWDVYRTKRRQIEHHEVLLCAAISVETIFLSGEPDKTTEKLARELFSKLEPCLGGSSEWSVATQIPVPLWEARLAADLLSSLGDKSRPRPEGDQKGPSSATPTAPPSMRTSIIRSRAERPMNSMPSPQLLFSSRDQHDVLRVGLALSEVSL
jgi:hypothetical protein